MFNPRITCLLSRCVATLCLSLAAWRSPAAETQPFDFFETRIRPVLIERCYECHSAQSDKIKGGLRLDTKAGLLRGGEGGPVLVPGNADQSRLIQAIRYEDSDLQMPPKKKLSDQQIADFVAWVNAGAPDPRTDEMPLASPETKAPKASPRDHWAFQPPKEHTVPSVKNVQWPKTPIDFFILAKLEEHGLSPAPLADKRTLIRRATFDLTGLPPTADDVDVFLRDDSAEAFARVVDRLLASPRYGERWGRYWLDVARYADTKGYVYSDREEARFVHSHAYRDWVIRAFNDDMPYDRFLRLQIAADQLVPESSDEDEHLAAMGFLTLGRRFLGVVHDIIDDRIDVVMRGTQALTVGCARCHDHKYDPISIKDYYALYGVFAGSTERMLSLSQKDDDDPAYREFVKGLRERIEKYDQTQERKRNEFSNRFRTNVTDYLVAVLDVKKLPTEEHYEIRGPNDVNPTIVRNWEAYLLQTKATPDRVFGLWHELQKLSETAKGDFTSAAAEHFKRLAAAPEKPNPLVWGALTNPPPASMRDVAQRYGALLLDIHRKWQETLQTAATNGTQAPSHLSDAAEEELRQVLYGPNSPVNIPKLAAADLEWYFDEGTRVELMKLHAEIERWIIKSPGAPPHAVILEDKPVQKNARVFLRGNPATKGDEVPRRFLEILAHGTSRPFRQGSGRLELANAITTPDNPLTARVMVNRIWLHHFGAGLVRTPSDFGTRSEPPSHPELLDWLARYFVSHGWSIKTMHRLIMLSSVYQQSSDSETLSDLRGGRREAPARAAAHNLKAPAGAKPDASLIDPENRLLWRMNRHRLDFEGLRDSLLVASGELDARMGGKPAELFRDAVAPRRTVYGLIDRQFLPGIFRVFDFANPDMHSPQRSDTTVPQQALFFMNSPFVVERARKLVARPDLAAIENPVSRIEHLHRMLFQRSPTPRQLDLGLQFLKSAEAEPVFEPPPPPPPVWFYGYGKFDTVTEQMSFTPLPYFSADAWQGGPQWPDEKLGWVRLTAEGGHAGNDLQHAAIRRWIAPMDAVISIAAAVKHDHTAGDGIRARVVSSRHGLLGEWLVHKSRVETKFEQLAVQKGDALDFVVDYRSNLNSDDFAWAPVIKSAVRADTASASEPPAEWNARKDFAGPPSLPPKPLNAWEKYAQVLLLSNEFLFVD